VQAYLAPMPDQVGWVVPSVLAGMFFAFASV
jgi:hypothetical protein